MEPGANQNAKQLLEHAWLVKREDLPVTVAPPRK